MAKYEGMSRRLRKKDFDDHIIEVFRTNKIDEETFLDLQRSDLKELGIAAIGDLIRIKRLKEWRESINEMMRYARYEVSMYTPLTLPGVCVCRYYNYGHNQQIRIYYRG